MVNIVPPQSRQHGTPFAAWLSGSQRGQGPGDGWWTRPLSQHLPHLTAHAPAPHRAL